MKRYTSLKEKVYIIEKDVNFIYNRAYKKFIQDFKNKKISLKKFERLLQNFNVEIKGRELKTKDCINAQNINPVIILCTLSTEINNSYYDAIVKKEEYPIVVVPNINLLHALIISDYNMDSIIVDKFKLDKNADKYKNELHYRTTELNIKQRISHELNHWIDDTSHGRFLMNRQLKAKEIEDNPILDDKTKEKLIQKIMSQNKELIILSDTEANSIIQQIQTIKNNVSKKEWDKFSLEDLFVRSGSLYSLAKNIRDTIGLSGFNDWQKDLIKRLNREKLLGNNMKNFIIFECVELRKKNFKKMRLY